MEKNEYTDENTIIELDAQPEETEEKPLETSKVKDEEIVVDLKKEEKIKKKKKKVKKDSFWSKLSKKGRIIVISSICLVVLIAAGIILYFTVFKKDKPEEEKENIVIEKDNYIYDNGSLKFLDEDDSILGTYKCKSKSEKKCYVAYLSNEDTFDSPIYEYTDGTRIEKRSKIYGKNYVFINDNNKITLYDIKKATSLGEYTLVKSGEGDDSIVVLKDEKNNYGMMKLSSSEAKTILDFEYEYLGIYNSSEAFVAKDGTTSYLIDNTGKKLSDEIRGEIKSFNDKYIAVYNDGYTLYNYDGEKVLENEYDYIDFNNNYVFVISGIKLYAYDKDLFKLNEAAIKLKTSDYTKKYIFDKDNNLKETKKAYSVTITNSSIEFEINDTTVKKINLYEAQINKNYNYVNYFDGVLYFYNDEAKANLIGSYNCINKNTVTTSGDEYINCFVAKENKIINEASNGYIPIINENYVYIIDAKTNTTNPFIILYDIAKSKSLSKYTAVDTGIGNENITQISITNNIVYAKNIDGYYGAITFGASGPNGLIAFKDDEGNGTTKMKVLGENILVKRGETNYLYTKVGEKLATSQFDIVNYSNGHTLVKNKNNKYLIYAMSNGSSGTILSEEFDYIEMDEKYFVGINGKKLNVYYYTNGKDALLEEDVEVPSATAGSFTIKATDKGYTISVTAGENATVDHDYDKNWSKLDEE